MAWLDDLLSPPLPPQQPKDLQKPDKRPPKEQQKASSSASLPHAPIAKPWRRLLRNVKELKPEFFRAMQIIQQQGVTLIQGEHQFFFGRGNFLCERDFELLISILYFHVILQKTKGSRIHDIFEELRNRGADLRETPTGLKLVKSKFLSDEDWEHIKKEMLEPNRDEILRVQRLARQEVSFILGLSRMAEVLPEKNVEWDKL